VAAEMRAVMATRPPTIYPPADYSPWWWLVVIGCLLAIVVTCWWAWRALRRLRPAATGVGLLATLRAQTITRIDVIERRCRTGELGAADAHQQLGAEVRRFVGTVTNGDADYRVLPELRREAVKDPRLDDLVRLVAALEAPAFAPGAPGRDLDTGFEDAREVVRRWG
jgi:hypothetical protein